MGSVFGSTLGWIAGGGEDSTFGSTFFVVVALELPEDRVGGVYVLDVDDDEAGVS